MDSGRGVSQLHRRRAGPERVSFGSLKNPPSPTGSSPRHATAKRKTVNSTPINPRAASQPNGWTLWTSGHIYQERIQRDINPINICYPSWRRAAFRNTQGSTRSLMTVFHRVLVDLPYNRETAEHQRFISIMRLLPLQLKLEVWAKEEGITLGPAIPDEKAKLDLLQLLWTYRDTSAKELSEIPATDLLLHRVTPREGIKPHQAPVKRLSNNKEWWLRTIVQEGIESGIYEKCIHANGRVSSWNANPVLVKNEGQLKLRLTFNYHFVYEVPPASHMELADRVHSLLGVPSHTTFFQADMKHRY